MHADVTNELHHYPLRPVHIDVRLVELPEPPPSEFGGGRSTQGFLNLY